MSSLHLRFGKNYMFNGSIKIKTLFAISFWKIISSNVLATDQFLNEELLKSSRPSNASTSHAIEQKIETAFNNSHGQKGNNNAPGHHLDHWIYFHPEHIGQKLDKKAEKDTPHTVFCSNPKDIFLHGMRTDPSIIPRLQEMIAGGETAEIIVNTKRYKGDKGFVELYGRHHAALPPYFQRAHEAVFIIEKKKNGDFHIKTAYPRKTPHWTQVLKKGELENFFSISSLSQSPHHKGKAKKNLQIEEYRKENGFQKPSEECLERYKREALEKSSGQPSVDQSQFNEDQSVENNQEQAFDYSGEDNIQASSDNF